MNYKEFFFFAAMGISAMGIFSPAHAQTYPMKPVKIIVAFPPGGGTDVVARLVGQKLAEAYGQSFIIENRAGAGGTLGSESVAKALPDGYTLTIATSSTHGIAPSVYRGLGYDPVRDFAPVTLLATTPFLLAVHPSVQANNLAELIALAKSKPSKLNYGSAGNGSGNQLATELLCMMAGVKMVHIPYKGAGPAIADLAAGHLDLIINDMSSLLPFVNSGKLRAIAVMGAKRNPALPNVPTASESGLPGYEGEAWYGLMAPAKTPPAITAQLQSDIAKAIRETDLKEKLRAQGLDAIGGTPEQFQTYLNREIAKWADVVKATGARVE